MMSQQHREGLASQQWRLADKGYQQQDIYGLGWDNYYSSWPGCTWQWLYLHPLPLLFQLDMMALVVLPIAELQWTLRRQSVVN